MYEVTNRVEAQYPEQPHSKQRERDSEQHVAFQRQPTAMNVAGCMVEVAVGVQL